MCVKGICWKRGSAPGMKLAASTRCAVCVCTHTLVLFTKVETGHLNEPHPNPPFNPGARLSKPRNPGESFQKEEHFKSENLATYGVTLSKVIICESPPETVPNHSVWYFRGSNEGSAVVQTAS